MHLSKSTREEIKTISILGCGWIGKALKKKLSTEGYSVYCLKRDIVENIQNEYYKVGVLVIAIPPKENYLEVLEQTLQNISLETQVIFLSSISFYDGKSIVVEAEKRIRVLHKEAVILRLGGLMGYDRVAGKYSNGKVFDFDKRTNYIHKDDVVGIINHLIFSKISNEIFDVVAPKQSTQKKIYNQNAKKFAFKESKFLGDKIEGKILTPQKLISILQYDFIHEDVEKFWDRK